MVTTTAIVEIDTTFATMIAVTIVAMGIGAMTTVIDCGQLGALGAYKGVGSCSRARALGY